MLISTYNFVKAIFAFKWENRQLVLCLKKKVKFVLSEYKMKNSMFLECSFLNHICI